MPDEVNLADIDALIESVGRTRESTISILQAVQAKYNWLPPEALQRVCETTDITPANIASVSTFYAQFRHKPAGKHAVKVCIGTACHVKGGETVFDSFKRFLGIEGDNDTDADGVFTVSKVACLGCCMLAPAVMVDDVTYGFVEPPKVGNVLRDFLESLKVSSAAAATDHSLKAEGEVRVCLCSSCVAGGAGAVHRELCAQIADLKLPVAVRSVGCMGISYRTPFFEVAMSGGESFHYGLVKPEDVRAILLRHFRPARMSGRMAAAVRNLLERILTDETREPITRYSVDLRAGVDNLYYGPQVHIATEHCGELDPLDIDAYMRKGGFDALKKVLAGYSQEEVVGAIKASGLRGRGGAGFPTGEKWGFVWAAEGEKKHIICNGDEGDPGAFMDRMILESFPYRVLEGMAIAAYAVGSTEGVLYVRAEYPLATKRIREALKRCEAKGVLGDNILGSGHSLRLRLVEGAGAFVCGEETALMAAVEGRRGMPRFRPPFPAQHGLWNRPTLINNVETYALVPWIIRNGPEKFAALGTKTSRGTKAFALAGKVRRGGLIEVPMGVSLQEVVNDIGGGIENDKSLKAVQVGGPSGGCVPSSLAKTPVDYYELVSAGAIMGSGGMVVLDETDCIVDIARYFLVFTQAESCGKCTFCRIGTRKMLDMLEAFCNGQGKPGDVERLENLARSVQQGSLCGLGKTAPNPILSTLKYFRDEYDAHIKGRCPSGKCKSLIKYFVTEDCIGCTKCAQQCPVDAIPFTPYARHEIDEAKCIRCDNCRKICPVNAIKIVDKNAG